MRHLSAQICAVCLGLWLPSAFVCAADEELDTITVIAAPEPQTGDVQHEEHAGGHQRIHKRELQRQDVNLGDILANETGLQFRQVGGLGTLTTVTMRGASSAQTGVFLDGIMLNSAGNSAVDLSMFELLNLSSVDIYRGGAPAQLSAASIGGAINLRTLTSSSTKPSTTAAITGGSYNTNRVQFSHSSRKNQWDIVAAIGRENSNNRFTLINNNATPLNAADDRREKRNNAQVSKLAALSRLGFQWNADTRTDVLLQASGRELGIPEWLNTENNEASYDTNAIEFQLINRVDGIGDWNTTLSLFQHYQDNHYLDALSQIGLGAQDTLSNTKTTGLKTYWERVGDNGTFSFSTTLRNESLDSEDTLAPNQNYSATRRAVLTHLQYAYFTPSERLLITPSVRFNSVDDDFRGISRSNDNQRSDNTVSPQIGFRYSQNDKLTLRSSVGQFIRQPAFSELFGSRGLIVGNDDLVPENGINADVGFSYTPSSRYQFNATLFGSWRDELISLIFDSRGIGRSANIGKARVYGLEVGNEMALNDRVSLRVNATYQHSENIDANPALNGRELPGEARLSSHTKLQYSAGKIRTWFESNFKSDFYYDRANLLPSKSYWLHNVGVDYQWQKFQFGLTANNIGNDTVEDFNGFPRPGRSYYLSLNYRL